MQSGGRKGSPLWLRIHVYLYLETITFLTSGKDYHLRALLTHTHTHTHTHIFQLLHRPPYVFIQDDNPSMFVNKMCINVKLKCTCL